MIQQLTADDLKRVRIVFRHFPLNMHPHAIAAAVAAEAAGLQGRFWEMHDLLYGEQSTWSTVDNAQATFDEYATRLGLDLKRFQTDCAGEKIKQVIAADKKHGINRGVSETPTILINGWAVPRDSYSVNGLRSRINMAVANAVQSTPATSPPRSTQ